MFWKSALSLNFSDDDDDDDDVDDDDDIGERMSFFSNSQERERHPAVVYLVISPLAVTKPEQWYVQWLGSSMPFNVVAGFHTSHWGLKIRGRYYDLKRHGKWPNASTSIEIVEGPGRKEREATSTVVLGMTHFDNYELNEICKYVKRLTRNMCYGSSSRCKHDILSRIIHITAAGLTTVKLSPRMY